MIYTCLTWQFSFERPKRGTDMWGKKDLFQLVNREIERRLQAMYDYPYLLQFAAKAYYESEEEIKSELEIRKKHLLGLEKRIC